MSLIAQAGIELKDKIILNPKYPEIGVGERFSKVSDFLNLLVPAVFILASFILLFLLIGGGFSIIASGGNAKNVDSGKNAITGAILGFLVMFAAFWIIQIVQVVTGVNILGSSL